MANLEEALKGIGLTGYEIKVYTALLELGEAKSGQILSKAGIYSGKIYEILNSLKNKGLVSETIKNNVKYFAPANPDRILDYLTQKEEKLEQQKRVIKGLIPDIFSKINPSGKTPAIEVYTGFEGMKTAFMKETKKYKKGVEVCVLGVKESEAYKKKEYDFFEYNIYPLREKNKVHVRKINDLDSRKKKGKENAEIRYLPHPSMTTINICQNLTIISMFLENPITITIESEDVARSFQNQFDLLWKLAKP